MLWKTRRNRKRTSKRRRPLRRCETLEPRIYLASDLLGLGSPWDAAWAHEMEPDVVSMVDIGRVTYETANEAALAANGGVLIAVPFDGAYEPDPSGYVAVGGGSIVNGPSLPHAVDGVVAGTEDFGADFAIDPMQPWLGEYSQGGMIRPIGEWVGAIRSPVGRTASGHFKPAAVYQYPLDELIIPQPSRLPFEIGGVEFGYLGLPVPEIPLEGIVPSDDFLSVPPSGISEEWNGTFGDDDLASIIVPWPVPERNDFGSVEGVDRSLTPVLYAPGLPDAVDGVVVGGEDFGVDSAVDPMHQWLGEYQYPWNGQIVPQSAGLPIEFGEVEFDYLGLPVTDIPLEEIITSGDSLGVPPSGLVVEWDGILGDGEFVPTVPQWPVPDWSEFGSVDVIDGSLAPALDVPQTVETVEFDSLHNNPDTLSSPSVPLTVVFDEGVSDTEDRSVISDAPSSSIESVAAFTGNDAPAGLINRTPSMEQAIAESDSGYLFVALVDGAAAQGPGAVEARETLADYHDVAQPVSSVTDTTTETDALSSDRSLVGVLSLQQLAPDGIVFVEHRAQGEGQGNLPAAIPISRQRGDGVDIHQSIVASTVMLTPERGQVLLSVVFGQPLTRLAHHRLSLVDRGTASASESPEGTAESWLAGLWAMLPHPHDISPISLTVGTIATSSLIGLVMYEWRLRKSRDDESLGLRSPASNMDETLLAVELL